MQENSGPNEALGNSSSCSPAGGPQRAVGSLGGSEASGIATASAALLAGALAAGVSTVSAPEAAGHAQRKLPRAFSRGAARRVVAVTSPSLVLALHAA